MKAGSPSRTAQGVVAERAVLHDLGVIDDPFADGMLTIASARIVAAVHRWSGPIRRRSLTLAGLAARIVWFDRQVVDALDAGVTQVAIVGAGYDTRTWRFRRDGVRWFEVDHPATQTDKVRRAPTDGPAFVAADVLRDSVPAALAAQGFDPDVPALLVVEGLTMYLPEDAVRQMLTELARDGAPGSRLAVNFAAPTTSGTSRHRRQALLQRLARTGSKEDFRLTIGREGAAGLVASCGWTVAESTGIRDAALDLVGESSGLAVDAVNPHGSLVAATNT